MAFFANCEEVQVRIAIIAVSHGSCSSNLTGLIAAGPYRSRGSLRRNHGPEVVTEARWAHPAQKNPAGLLAPSWLYFLVFVAAALTCDRVRLQNQMECLLEEIGSGSRS